MIAKQSFLEWISGNDPDHAGSARLQWSNLPESWGVFVLIAVVAAMIFGVVWLYRRETATCPMPVKLLLAAIRLTVLLMLVAMLLRPSIFYQQVNEIKPVVNLVRDASLSFARGDMYRSDVQVSRLSDATGIDADRIASGDVSRSEMLNRVLNNPKLVDAIREKSSIQVVDFSDGTKSVAVIPAIVRSDSKTADDKKNAEGAESEPTADENDQISTDDRVGGLIRLSIPELIPNGLGTDIWQALRESLNNASRLSAIILVSDGQHNGSEDPTEIAQLAQSLGIPIFVVGIGDPNPPKNLAVNEVFVRNKAYPDEPFEVEAMLQASSLGSSADMPDQIEVQLVEQKIDARTGKPGSEQVVETRDLKVPDSGGRIRVDFERTINQPGKYIYSVVAQTIAGEINTNDNRRTSGELEVVDEKVKVLLIAGLPSWDYQQVQRLLQRDPTISLSCWLQSMDQSRPQEGNDPISRLPRSIEELGKYNMVMMMDPNPAEFDAQWIDTLKTFCKNKAGGLLFMAGPHFTGEFVTLNRLQGIRDILPIRLGDTEYIATTQALASATDNQPGDMLLVSHNMDHPVLSFHSEPAETQRRWAQMPGVYWSFPAISGKPTARVMIERGDQVGAEGNQPLMVSGRYGAGTILYMGFQGTWRWRPVGLQAQFFDRFWIQVTRYLVENRSLQGSRRGFIDCDKTEYELGDRVLLIGRVLDSQFKPSSAESVIATIRSDDGRIQKVEMQLLPGQQGRYEGMFLASRTGMYEATIEIERAEGEEKLIDPVSFRIVPPRVESNAFWLNEKLLREIAEQSGGKYFLLDELDKLPEVLPRLVTRAEFNSPPEPLWDWNRFLRILAFLLPVALLTTEWAIRKWYKLL